MTQHGRTVPGTDRPDASAGGQALAGVAGPLIEVPVMVALVYLSLWACRRYYPAEQEAA